MYLLLHQTFLQYFSINKGVELYLGFILYFRHGLKELALFPLLYSSTSLYPSLLPVDIFLLSHPLIFPLLCRFVGPLRWQWASQFSTAWLADSKHVHAGVAFLSFFLSFFPQLRNKLNSSWEISHKCDKIFRALHQR